MATASRDHEAQRIDTMGLVVIEQAHSTGAALSRQGLRGLRVAWLGHKSQTIGDGLRTYSRNVTGALAARGAEILFVHHEPLLDDGAGSVSLRASPTFQRRVVIANPGAGRRLRKLLREHPVDVVHLSAPFSTLDFAMPRICQSLGLPIAVTFHVPFASSRSLWASLALAAYRAYAPSLATCDRVIVLGPAQRRMLVDMGVPEQAIEVHPNGVDVDRYSPGPSTAFDGHGAGRMFSFIGRIDPEKRVEELVRAFLDVSKCPDTRLVLVGDGTELGRLSARYAGPRVVFTGPILDERRRIDILRASDAFFLPSVLEAQSLALLEAMACGVAVAATPVGDQLEALTGAGIVLDADDIAGDLRRRIAELESSPELCRALGARARARAVEMFSLDAHVDGLASVYRSLAG